MMGKKYPPERGTNAAGAPGTGRCAAYHQPLETGPGRGVQRSGSPKSAGARGAALRMPGTGPEWASRIGLRRTSPAGF